LEKTRSHSSEEEEEEEEEENYITSCECGKCGKTINCKVHEHPTCKKHSKVGEDSREQSENEAKNNQKEIPNGMEIEDNKKRGKKGRRGEKGRAFEWTEKLDRQLQESFAKRMPWSEIQKSLRTNRNNCIERLEHLERKNGSGGINKDQQEAAGNSHNAEKITTRDTIAGHANCNASFLVLNNDEDHSKGNSNLASVNTDITESWNRLAAAANSKFHWESVKPSASDENPTKDSWNAGTNTSAPIWVDFSATTNDNNEQSVNINVGRDSSWDEGTTAFDKSWNIVKDDKTKDNNVWGEEVNTRDGWEDKRSDGATRTEPKPSTGGGWNDDNPHVISRISEFSEHWNNAERIKTGQSTNLEDIWDSKHDAGRAESNSWDSVDNQTTRDTTVTTGRDDGNKTEDMSNIEKQNKGCGYEDRPQDCCSNDSYRGKINRNKPASSSIRSRIQPVPPLKSSLTSQTAPQSRTDVWVDMSNTKRNIFEAGGCCQNGEKDIQTNLFTQEGHQPTQPGYSRKYSGNWVRPNRNNRSQQGQEIGVNNNEDSKMPGLNSTLGLSNCMCVKSDAQSNLPYVPYDSSNHCQCQSQHTTGNINQTEQQSRSRGNSGLSNIGPSQYSGKSSGSSSANDGSVPTRNGCNQPRGESDNQFSDSFQGFQFPAGNDQSHESEYVNKPCGVCQNTWPIQNGARSHQRVVQHQNQHLNSNQETAWQNNDSFLHLGENSDQRNQSSTEPLLKSRGGYWQYNEIPEQCNRHGPPHPSRPHHGQGTHWQSNSFPGQWENQGIGYMPNNNGNAYHPEPAATCQSQFPGNKLFVHTDLSPQQNVNGYNQRIWIDPMPNSSRGHYTNTIFSNNQGFKKVPPVQPSFIHFNMCQTGQPHNGNHSGNCVSQDPNNLSWQSPNENGHMYPNGTLTPERKHVHWTPSVTSTRNHDIWATQREPGETPIPDNHQTPSNCSISQNSPGHFTPPGGFPVSPTLYNPSQNQRGTHNLYPNSSTDTKNNGW
jgi:hypothetical protein